MTTTNRQVKFLVLVVFCAHVAMGYDLGELLRQKRTICDSSMDFTVHPDDCNKFYRCSNGYLYTLKCPRGTVFDDNLKYCNYASAFAGKCGLLDKKCDQSIDLTRVPGECSKFYRCANGRLYTRECPGDTVFDNKYKVCNFPLNVDDECGAASPSCASLDFTVNPDDCTRFYRCANNILYSFVCPSQTVFDSNLKLCNYPMNVKGKCGSQYNQYNRSKGGVNGGASERAYEYDTTSFASTYAPKGGSPSHDSSSLPTTHGYSSSPYLL